MPQHQHGQHDGEHTSCGSQRSATNAPACCPLRSTASRLVRLEIGSSRLAALASHTVANANGSGGRPSSEATASETGVSITAVVSMPRVMVVTVASAQ